MIHKSLSSPSTFFLFLPPTTTATTAATATAHLTPRLPGVLPLPLVLFRLHQRCFPRKPFTHMLVPPGSPVLRLALRVAEPDLEYSLHGLMTSYSTLVRMNPLSNLLLLNVE
jgi:hypothetical protein